MSWRLPDATGPDARYAFVCPQCGFQYGWPTKATAQKHLLGLRSIGTVAGEPEEYRDGDDFTCPHVGSLDLPAPRVEPKRHRATR